MGDDQVEVRSEREEGVTRFTGHTSKMTSDHTIILFTDCPLGIRITCISSDFEGRFLMTRSPLYDQFNWFRNTSKWRKSTLHPIIGILLCARNEFSYG